MTKSLAMDPMTQILLLGKMSERDDQIRRALNAAWFKSQIYRAPTSEAAIKVLTREAKGSWPIKPDIIVLKVPEPETADDALVRGIRRFKLLQEAPIAAIVEKNLAPKLRCLRNCGLSAVFTLDTLQSNVTDLVDAVVDYWIRSYCDDCNNRYFCPDCQHCVYASRLAAG